MHFTISLGSALDEQNSTDHHSHRVLLVTNMHNSLWPSGATRRYISRSTMAQIMPFCLTTPNHCLKQCWLLINEFPLHSYEITFTARICTILYTGILNYAIDITFTSHSRQRVKSSSVAPIPDTWATDFHYAWRMNSVRRGDRLVQTPHRINTDKLRATQS